MELPLGQSQAARFKAAAASPYFREAFDRLLGELAIDRTAWPVLQDITWNRSDRWIPADEALALYERNWRHVDEGQISKDEAELIHRLAERFGGGVFNG